MQRKIVAVIVLALILAAPIAALAAPAQSSDSNGSGKAVFILMDNITWDDIIAANDPVLNQIIGKSSVGVLNNRAFKQPSRPRNALSAGASGRAGGNSASFEGYNAGEPYDNGLAMDAFRLRTGTHAKKGQVLELGIAAITRDNTTDMQRFYPGKLGDAIAAAGKKTAAFGNADTSLGYDNRYSLNREITLIAMDGHGAISFGDVGKGVLERNADYPFGIKTDYKKLSLLLRDALKKADFVAIDLGDTARADLYQKYTFDVRAQNYKARAIRDGARFVEQAMKTAGDDTTFIIAALSPPGSTKAPLRSSMEQLTPIIVSGPAFTAGGLTSASTHRDGLVTITDIAPTVLSALGIPKDPDMVGSEFKTGSASITPERLASFNRSAVGVKDTRRLAILAYIYIQIALYVFAAVVLAYRKILNKTSSRILETLIFTTMSFPLFSFYTTKLELLATQKLIATILTIVVSLIFATALVAIRKKALQPVLGIVAVTLAALSIDVLVGGPSFLNSIFGYDPIRGARFFGIGNEAMSIIVACTLLLFGIMLEGAWNKWTVLAGAVLGLAIAVLIGFPGLGTNTGGLITAFSAFSTMTLLAMRSGAKWRNAAIAVASVIIALGIFASYDATHGASTHMGKSLNLIIGGGFAEAFIITKRKLATNMMIFRFSTWSYFLFIALGLLVFLWTKPAGVLRKLLADHRGISAAISASIVGAIVGFAFNDSGILVPAIIMSYIIPTVVYLMLWEQNHSTE